MGIFNVTLTGPPVEKSDIPDVVDSEGNTVKANVERGMDGKHIRILTCEANNEDHARKIAIKQAEDIATQDAYRNGLELDLEVADFVEKNAFQVHSVEKVKAAK